MIQISGAGVNGVIKSSLCVSSKDGNNNKIRFLNLCGQPPLDVDLDPDPD